MENVGASYDDRMTIAIDLRPLLGGNVSGVTTYIRNILPLIFRFAKQHTFVLFVNAKPRAAREVLRSFSGDNVISVATHMPNKLLTLSLALFGRPRLDRLILKRCKKVDRIDCFFVPDPRPVALSPMVRCVSTFHDLSFVHFPWNFTWKTRLFHRLMRPRALAERSDRVIAVSEFTKEDVCKTYDISPDKVSVIYEGAGRGLSCVRDAGMLAALRKKYRLPERFFLSLSTLEPRKNLLNVLKAFARFQEQTGSDCALVVAGRSEPRIFQKLTLPQNPAVHCIGFVAEEDKAALLSLATALVSISYFEGFGLPLVEAMACGTPVIAARAGATPEITGDAALLVDPFDIETIARAFATMLQEDARAAYAAKAQERAQQFSWEEAARRTLEVLTNF